MHCYLPRLVLFALLASGCAVPSEPPEPPGPTTVAILPGFAQHDLWCAALYDTLDDGDPEFEERASFDANDELVRYTLRDFVRATTSTFTHYRDAAGRELDMERATIPDSGLSAFYGHRHSTYDDAGRLIRQAAGGGDGRVDIVIRTYVYDERGRAVEIRDVSLEPSFAPSQTDFQTFDDEDRPARLERDVGNDGTIDLNVDAVYEGTTTTTTQDNPPRILREVDDDLGNVLVREVDDGADGELDEGFYAQLDEAGQLLGYDFDEDGDGEIDVSSAYSFDETAKTLTIEAHAADGSTASRNVFDYSCFPFVQPDRGGCAVPFVESGLGCATWRLGPALDFGRQRHFAGRSPAGGLVALGGSGGHDNGVIVQTAESVNVDAIDPVVRGPFLQIGGGAEFAALADGRVMIVGGRVGGELLPDVAIYDPAAQELAVGQPLLEPRHSALVTALDDGTVLVAGGFTDASFTNSVEIVTPGAAFSTLAQEMPGFVAGGAIVSLPGASAIVLGGATAGGAERVTQIFNGSTGLWRLGPDLAVGRSAFATAVLTDGRVLVAGGLDSSSSPIADAELFDPGTGADSIAALPLPLADATAIVLSDGRALVVGGRTGAARDGASAETFVYDAVADAWLTGPPLFVARSRAQGVLLEDGRVALVGGATSDLQTTAAVEILEIE